MSLTILNHKNPNGTTVRVQVGPDVKIGKKVHFEPGTMVTLYRAVTVGDFATIGAGSTVFAQSTIGARATIGSNVELGYGTRIGVAAYIGNDVKMASHVVVGRQAQVPEGAVVSTGNNIYVTADAINL